MTHIRKTVLKDISSRTTINLKSQVNKDAEVYL